MAAEPAARLFRESCIYRAQETVQFIPRHLLTGIWHNGARHGLHLADQPMLLAHFSPTKNPTACLLGSPKTPPPAFWGGSFRAQGSSQPLTPLTSISLPAQQLCPSDGHQLAPQAAQTEPEKGTKASLVPECITGSHPILYSRVAPQKYAPFRCLVSPPGPAVTRCPAMTREICFLQAQSSLGHKPSLTLGTRRHYGQRSSHADGQRRLTSQTGNSGSKSVPWPWRIPHLRQSGATGSSQHRGRR